MPAIPLLWLGFLLGMRHACDPDHVVAVTTILGKTQRIGEALRIGAFWGLGHCATLLVVGVAMVLFGVTLPAAMAGGMELAVASMLLVFGVRALRRPASADRETATARRHARHVPAALRPLVIGLVHGLAGSGALVLLATAEIRSRSGALAYLALFGVGTMLGMMTITLVLAAPFVYGGGRLAATRTVIVRGAGVMGISLGVVIAWRVLVRP